jgi:hypothetical protein
MLLYAAVHTHPPLLRLSHPPRPRPQAHIPLRVQNFSLLTRNYQDSHCKFIFKTVGARATNEVQGGTTRRRGGEDLEYVQMKALVHNTGSQKRERTPTTNYRNVWE